MWGCPPEHDPETLSSLSRNENWQKFEDGLVNRGKRVLKECLVEEAHELRVALERLLRLDEVKCVPEVLLVVADEVVCHAAFVHEHEDLQEIRVESVGGRLEEGLRGKRARDEEALADVALVLDVGVVLRQSPVVGVLEEVLEQELEALEGLFRDFVLNPADEILHLFR